MDRDKVLLTAQKLVDKKRYDKAIAEYQKLVVDDPTDVRTMLKIGDLYLRLEAHGDAITTYERVGDYYHKQGFALKAIAVYKQIREIVHKHVPHLEDRFGHIVPRLAEIYTQLGLTSDALAAYDEVATRLQRAGRDRDAIDIFKKVVDLDPQNPLPHLRLAEAYIRVKGVDNAIDQFGSAASILLRLGRQDDALKVVERLLMHRADARFARMAAETYLGRGAANDGMAALTKLQICFKENPRDLETLALLARTFDHLGQPAKAVEVHKEAARIALDAGKQDEFAEIVELLMQRAPDDDEVKALSSSLNAVKAPPPPPPIDELSMEEPPSIEAVSIDGNSVSVELDDLDMVEDDVQEIDDVELIDDVEEIDDVVEDEPFPLRPSQPPAEQGSEPIAQVRAVLMQVEQLRRQRQYQPAIAALKSAAKAMPEFRELRERLCDLLIESGDQDGAIEQMLIHAQHLALRDDADGAARVLDEVLLLEPDHQDAVRMLGSLGYAVPEPSIQPPSSLHREGAPSSRGGVEGPYPPGSYQDAAYPPSSAYQPPASQPLPPRAEPPQSLPAYNLDAVPGSEFRPASPAIQDAGAPPAGPLVALDDPFAVDANAPLPSFPIEDEPPMGVAPVVVPPLAAPPASLPPPVSSPRPSMRASTPGQLDEDALEEIEFFSAHGMFDEARGILTDQLAMLPNHPILLEKQQELEAMVSAASAQSGAREVPLGAPETEDRSFDIAASLDALDSLEGPKHAAPEPVDEQFSVDAVFEQFKAGVAAQVAEGDAQTHYDLGVAYKEMGLLTDAISEMETASLDPSRECVCQSMVGMWQLELGNIELAIDAFLRGFHAPGKDAMQELALTYEIGNAYELLNQLDQALYYFQKAAQLDPNYSDPRGSIEDRIGKLSPAPAPKPAKAAVGAAPSVADEFDAAFEELLGDDDKLP